MVIDAFTLRNRHGMTVRFIDYGGSVVSIEAPDRSGQMADVVLGYDSVEGYEADRSYFGGCSNGGRHTMVAASRLGDQYDGFLVGDL